MPHSFNDAELWRMPAEDRLALAQDIIESVLGGGDFPLADENQLREVESRSADIAAGTMPTHPWEDVKRRLRDSVGNI